MNQTRRQFLGATAATGMAFAAGLTLPQAGRAAGHAPDHVPMVKAGIITDLHHTTKADTPTRKYSASMAKMDAFMDAMKHEKPAFVVEMGDFVDTLAAGTDPAENLKEIEKRFTSYVPAYHVLGNHEFDNLTREFVLKALTNTGIPQGQTWYSWDNNGVHFVVLDADYTPSEPHRAYDMNTPSDTFWTWKDTFVPPQELSWLEKDLSATALPTVIFTHQVLDRVDDQDHTIKNASAVRKILEDSGKVLAVISGHDHAGGYANIKDIHYIVMNGNVGTSDSRLWLDTSQKEGFDTRLDNQFAVLEIFSNGSKEFRIRLSGFGRQASYDLVRVI
ncbi:metallophosphoesterase [uncultured Desulfobacter sp.]|uniref:metallophosphoesterase n=1 Tax=uncultured Desulfobacter sp. TaxID=240139 RepID=UPI002AAAEECC|nr:metallophosphoesterase [uncultured Desulfobacter sp.]